MRKIDVKAQTTSSSMPVRTPRLIALVGAESTGKTSLAQILAQRLGGIDVPEYLREFVQENARTPVQSEQAAIMQEQARREDAALEMAQQTGCPYVFCDASTLMTAIYSVHVFNDRSLLAQAQFLHRRYALTLLLNNDVQWQANGIQRDGPHVRTPVFQLLYRQLRRFKAPFFQVSGIDDYRLNCAFFALSCALYLSE